MHYREWRNEALHEYNNNPNIANKMKMKEAEKRYEKVRNAVSNFRSYTRELIQVSKLEFKLQEFRYAICNLKNIYSKKTKKLFDKEFRKIIIEQLKLDKNLSRLYKKHKADWIYEDEFNHWISLENAFKENQIHIYNKSSFSGYIKEKISKERYDVYAKVINDIENQINAKPSIKNLTSEGIDALSKLKKINFIENKYAILLKDNFTKLKEKYSEIVELSKEIRYTEETLEKFRTFEDTNVYKEISSSVQKLKQKLSDMCEKADVIFDSLNIEEKIKLIETLERLNEQIMFLIDEKNKLELERQYEKARNVQEKINKLRSEMHKIINANPELKKIKHNFYYLEEKNESKRSLFSSNDKQVKKSKETKKVDLPEDEKQNKKSTIKEEPKDLISTYRTAYIKEKIAGTELGRKDFSEYLSIVAPKQTYLIKKIKSQEEKTRTMYADYIKVSVLRRKNGYPYISFKQFVEEKYKIEDYSALEIPLDIGKKIEK